MPVRRFITILPVLLLTEASEPTRICPITGLTGDSMAVITTRPFRAPPHTISDAGLIGDGYVSMPGEVYGRLRASSPSMSCGHISHCLEILFHPCVTTHIRSPKLLYSEWNTTATAHHFWRPTKLTPSEAGSHLDVDNPSQDRPRSHAPATDFLSRRAGSQTSSAIRRYSSCRTSKSAFVNSGWALNGSLLRFT